MRKGRDTITVSFFNCITRYAFTNMLTKTFKSLEAQLDSWVNYEINEQILWTDVQAQIPSRHR